MPDETPKLPTTEAGMVHLLRLRYPKEEGWLQFSNLRNRTGYGGGDERYADFAALQTWASRDHAFHVFEVKVSRSDWLRELKDPGKADPMAKYANHWWLAVANDKIVQPGELPTGWGLLIPEVYRGKLRYKVVEAAPARTPEPFSKGLVLSMARHVQSQLEHVVPKSEIDARIRDASAQAVERALARDPTRNVEQRLHEYERIVTAFEEASGVSLRVPWGKTEDIQNIGRAVQLILQAGDVQGVALRALVDAEERVKRQLKLLKEWKEECEKFEKSTTT